MLTRRVKRGRTGDVRATSVLREGGGSKGGRGKARERNNCAWPARSRKLEYMNCSHAEFLARKRVAAFLDGGRAQ